MQLHNEEEARAFVAARCSGIAMSKLERLVARLSEANMSQNLVAKSSIASVWTRHIADSVQLIDHVSRETSPWLDLGSGAGFPGLVVAVTCPERDVVLVESRRLRITWLENMIAELGLPQCRVLGMDVRQVARFEAAVISARAFAPLPRLVDISARFSTNVTEWVLPKGRSAAQDVAKLPAHLRARFHVKQSVTDQESGILIARGKLDLAA